MIDAGKVKSLAVMADKPAALYPNVPTLKAATGSNWTMAAWRGHRGAEGPSARSVATSWSRRSRRSSASKDYTEFMAQAGLRRDLRRRPTISRKFMAKSDADLGATMKAVGIVK